MFLTDFGACSILRALFIDDTGADNRDQYAYALRTREPEYVGFLLLANQAPSQGVAPFVLNDPPLSSILKDSRGKPQATSPVTQFLSQFGPAATRALTRGQPDPSIFDFRMRRAKSPSTITHWWLCRARNTRADDSTYNPDLDSLWPGGPLDFETFGIHAYGSFDTPADLPDQQPILLFPLNLSLTYPASSIGATFTDYFANYILDLMRTGYAPGWVFGQYFVGLFYNQPTPAGAYDEVTASDYARVQLSKTSFDPLPSVLSANQPRFLRNKADLIFTASAAEPWGSPLYYGLFNTLEGGNLLFYAPLGYAPLINTGSAFRLYKGQIEFGFRAP